MEDMLAEHAPPSLSTKVNSKVQSPERYQSAMATTAASLGSSSSTEAKHDISPKWDGVTRIEAMWQNLTLKPLERQLTDAGLDLNENSTTKQGYNSISLQQEMAKVAEEGDKNSESAQQSTTDLLVERPPPVAMARVKSVAAHTVHVEHCRRVFEDEIYREELVNEAVSALRSGKSNVCFVVTPHTRKPENRSCNEELTGGDEDELAEMALRSLYIDVKQAVAASSEEFVFGLSLSSWPMRPKLCQEASGCITVKLGPA
ncbi:hypothetical protein PR003_g7983 [Phytophthora rubi]|uniref:Uncharacterized protein n=1 Tax=Phytophthora rubi TaxID=129364 RepID=A0A6A3N492_9STRA|nr:hypothetical protein PR002_g7746 [Phytophthora rubi]KAE9345369.1 hypothetical protein PR003_g7983 [Phytophthora rubi]